MPPHTFTDAEPVAEFLRLVGAAIDAGEFVSLMLSDRQRDRDDQPRRFDVRPVSLRGGPSLQWTARRERQVTHENLSHAKSLDRLASLLLAAYRQARLQTTTGDVEFSLDHGQRGRLRAREAARPSPVLEHNRGKQYLLPEGRPIPFLAAIGIMTPEGKVRAAQYDKFRQLNRYLEFIADIYDSLPAEGVLQVVDFGCGKSYLSFAVRHLLTTVYGREFRLTGLDRELHVIDACRRAAAELGYADMQFQVGDIAGYQPAAAVHLAISLHACDTATDDALNQAVRWQTPVILAVPCCQHEAAAQMDALPLDLIARHGLFKDRLAAMATDALRAAALEAAGYKTQVLEFIDMEHTPKNVLLRAVRREQPTGRESEWRERYAALKQLLGLSKLRTDELLAEQPGLS